MMEREFVIFSFCVSPFSSLFVDMNGGYKSDG